ncbi:MAG TPA: AmmeMemoRadiSam system protein B [Atribacterota bacterium]|nr:AmmeMemoRadiSam system protein B [Atribacterota bacterium]
MNIFKFNTRKNYTSLFPILIIFLSLSTVLILIFVSTLEIFASDSGNKQDIVSGVVPHHLLAKEIIADFFSYISSQGKPETIVILSPDHFQSGIFNDNNAFITLNWESVSIKEEFDNIKIDSLLGKKLADDNKIALNSSAIVYDHGITNLIPYIKKYFPESKFLPILIPIDITKEQIEHLVKTINIESPAQTIIIASVDFSHYLPPHAAGFHDKKSIRVLLNFEEENFKNIEVDCWQALYAARLFAKLRHKAASHIIAHKNSVDFSKLYSEITTSYFSVAFGEKKIEKTFNPGAKTVLFVGDIMLDRGVEYLVKQNSIYYPFQNISHFLRGIDIVFGNLEGPVVENPPQFPDDSLKFAFTPEVIKGASWSHFNLFSLSNNHTPDMGKEGSEETKEWLKKYGINFVGDPLSGSSDNLNSSFYRDDITFLAFNQIFPFMDKEEEIIKTIKMVKSSNPDNFLIVSMHWGEEYKLINSPVQHSLAHRIIEAGGDLIIGHHPHVVQNIEKYQGKLIFYSLGNFIFDQYFSTETQEGLAVGLEIHPDKLVCRLFPLQINLSQPVLMERDKAREFLIQLANRSDNRLVDEIKSGIIKIERWW